MESMDNILPFHLENLLFLIMAILSVVVAIIYSIHWFLLAVIPLAIGYFLIMVILFVDLLLNRI
jgi:hypothetical protein